MDTNSETEKIQSREEIKVGRSSADVQGTRIQHIPTQEARSTKKTTNKGMPRQCGMRVTQEEGPRSTCREQQMTARQTK